jgi:hypothetical protein
MIPMRASVKLQAKLWLNPIMFHALGVLIAANDALSFSARGIFLLRGDGCKRAHHRACRPVMGCKDKKAPCSINFAAQTCHEPDLKRLLGRKRTS